MKPLPAAYITENKNFTFFPIFTCFPLLEEAVKRKEAQRPLNRRVIY
jgi:hypothetical protein